MTTEFQISLSSIDEEHFGYKTASASYVGKENIDEMLDFCRANEVEFLIARCSASDLDAVQRMESEGFQLMDTLMYFRYWLGKKSHFPEMKSVPFLPLETGEEREVEEVAKLAFKDYYGHYHSDERLDQQKCDEVYSNWAYQACLSRGPEREVLVHKKDGKIIAFLVLEINSEGYGVPILTGIHPDHQRSGIYAAVAYPTWQWFLSKGLKYSMVSTQATNIAQQKYFIRFGYRPHDAVYTLHKWFV